MAARNYIKGRAFEYRVQNYLRSKGFYVLRAYGSKGLYDLLAIWPNTKPDFYNLPLMIQCKSNNYVKPSERDMLQECKNRWQGWQLIAFKDEKGHIQFRTLDGTKIVSI